MVDRLQYQNQIYSTPPQVVVVQQPSSQQQQVLQQQSSQQQQQPQIIIPTTATNVTGGRVVVQQQQQQRQFVNSIPLRLISQQPHHQQQQILIPTTTRGGVVQQQQRQFISSIPLRLIPQQQGYRAVAVQQQHQQQRAFQYFQQQPNGQRIYRAVATTTSTQQQQQPHLQQQQQYRAVAVQQRTTAIQYIQQPNGGGGGQRIYRAASATASTQYIRDPRPVAVKNEVVMAPLLPTSTTTITTPSTDVENNTTTTSGDNVVLASDNNTINNEQVMTISINNVVCNYSLPMHIDLRKLALNSWNCTYDRAGSILTKQKRHPLCHVKVYNSGKVYIVGSKSEAEARQAARGIGREIQKIMGKTDQKICLRKFKINNILATCKFPFGILIDQVNRQYPKETYYEPELTVGLIWRMTEPKASIRIHTTGTIVVTGATSEADVSTAVEKIYGYVKDFRCDPNKISHAAPRKRKAAKPSTTGDDEFSAIKIPKFQEFDDDVCGEAGSNLFIDEENIDEEEF